MAKKTAEKRCKILYKSETIKIYKTGRDVIFVYSEHGSDEDGSNDSFCEVVKTTIFKKTITELSKRGSCILSKYLELDFNAQNKKLTITYHICDCHTLYLVIDNFDFSRLFF